MHSYWTEFLALAAIHFLAVVAPGPDFAITIRQSLRFGRKIGIITAIGIGAGISLHVAYTLLGIGGLLQANPSLLRGAGFAGAIYLFYLGVKLLGVNPVDLKDADEINGDYKHEAMAAGKAFALGFLTNATNPKATLFFLAIFTTIVSHKTPLYIQTAYGVWMCFVNALWFAFVATLMTVENVRVRFLRFSVFLDRFAGALFIFFAFRLVYQFLIHS